MSRTDSINQILPIDSVNADTSAQVVHIPESAESTAPTAPTPPTASTSTATPSAANPVRVAPARLTQSTTLPTDTLKTVGDSKTAGDSIGKKEKVFGLVLDAPEVPVVKDNNSHNFGMSCILAGLFLLFCIIGLRFRNNSKYITSLLHNLVEVRERSNVFDETVRETSFIVLLNLLWSCSAGMVLCALLDYSLPNTPTASFGIEALSTQPTACTAICMGIMILYTTGMALAYLTVGSVFYDLVHARMWLKGYLASQGLLAIFFFPLALLLLYYPEWSQPLLWTALGSFLLTKIIFIWKGFRIFFTQFSSWVLFLYYLCSLEIVPLILTYWAACQLCSLL